MDDAPADGTDWGKGSGCRRRTRVFPTADRPYVFLLLPISRFLRIEGGQGGSLGVAVRLEPAGGRRFKRIHDCRDPQSGDLRPSDAAPASRPGGGDPGSATRVVHAPGGSLLAGVPQAEGSGGRLHHHGDDPVVCGRDHSAADAALPVRCGDRSGRGPAQRLGRRHEAEAGPRRLRRARARRGIHRQRSARGHRHTQ